MTPVPLRCGHHIWKLPNATFSGLFTGSGNFAKEMHALERHSHPEHYLGFGENGKGERSPSFFPSPTFPIIRTRFTWDYGGRCRVAINLRLDRQLLLLGSIQGLSEEVTGAQEKLRDCDFNVVRVSPDMY